MGVLAAATKTTPTVEIPNLISPVLRGLWLDVRTFWPWLLLIGIAALAKGLFHVYDLRRLARSGIDEVDRMDGRTFEVFLSTVFRRLGYRVEMTKYRGDWGADLIVERNGQKTVVQAKRWNKRVGVKAIQEAVAAKAMYGCSEALVVANRDFTDQAKDLARVNGVDLWDRRILVAKLLASHEAEPESVSVPQDAHCVVCGDRVTPKVRDWCLARPERFGGRVYCYTHQRGINGVTALG